MNIVGKRVLLRAVEEKDLSAFHQWTNDPEIASTVGGWHFPSSKRDQLQWFNGLTLNSLHQRFAIEDEKEMLIGTANLVNINWKDRNAEHGLLIERGARGKGYGQDVVMAIMRYAFDELGLNRLDSTIISYNKPSIQLYTGKCGWVIEGIQKAWYYRKGNFWDRLHIGITHEGYVQLVEKSGYWK